MNRQLPVPGIAACVLAALLALAAVVEAGLRRLYPIEQAYYVWLPGDKTIYRPAPGAMPGINGDARVWVNQEGLRSEEVPEGRVYRLLAVGGSTTECLFLDQEKTWTQLLERRLDGVAGRKVWVGNAGKSGCRSRNNLLQVERLLERHPNVDGVLLLVGINDLHLRLSEGASYRPLTTAEIEASPELVRESFRRLPGRESEPWYRRLGLWRAWERLKPAVFSPDLQEAGRLYVAWRLRRQRAAGFERALPDLTSALEEYRRNINRIIDLCRQRRVRLVLMTQPVMWRAGLPKALDALLWYGGIGEFQNKDGLRYYSPAALDAGMRLYNHLLLDLCRERGVECVDLASSFPRDTRVFYDDVHFNEGGAALVAQALFDYLRLRPPFAAVGLGSPPATD